MEALASLPRAKFCLCWGTGNSYPALAGWSLGPKGFTEGKQLERRQHQSVISRQALRALGVSAEVRRRGSGVSMAEWRIFGFPFHFKDGKRGQTPH